MLIRLQKLKTFIGGIMKTKFRINILPGDKVDILKFKKLEEAQSFCGIYSNDDIIIIYPPDCHKFIFEVVDVFTFSNLATIVKIYFEDELIGYSAFLQSFFDLNNIVWLDERKEISTQFQCTCERSILCNSGCQCGAFKAEMEHRKKLKLDAENKRLFS